MERKKEKFKYNANLPGQLSYSGQQTPGIYLGVQSSRWKQVTELHNISPPTQTER